MIRKIIKINEEKCNGCGICAEACHEGAIGMVDGKAKLLREDYCDGLGDCLPACPVEAISFETREAPAYDHEAVLKAQKENKDEPTSCACQSSVPQNLEGSKSHLAQWPVQIKLVPPTAPYLSGADLLIAADCTSFSFGDFHRQFMKGKVTLIGCPKLDMEDYSEKLSEILRLNDISSVHVARMEVPCCGGIEFAVKNALAKCGKNIPLTITTFTIDGDCYTE